MLSRPQSVNRHSSPHPTNCHYLSRTMRIISVASLIITLLASSILINGQTTTTTVAIPFTEFLRAYPEIERYLVQNVNSDDVNENINKAREYLQLQLAKPTQEQQLALIEALQKFVSLAGSVGEQETCAFHRYITLYYNYLASRSSQSEASLRVARIVDQFALRHAHLCTDFYGAQVRQRYDQMKVNSELDSSIESLLDSALKSATGSNMVEDLVQHFQQQNAPVLGSSQTQLIYRILVEQSAREQDPDASALASTSSACEENDEAGELTIDKENYEALERLFERHIKQPCKSLVARLRDVMEPAAFDVLYHPKRQDDFFYIIWARYKLCDTMSSEVRHKLLMSLVQLACTGVQH